MRKSGNGKGGWSGPYDNWNNWGNRYSPRWNNNHSQNQSSGGSLGSMARKFQNILGESAALSQMSQLGGLLAASQPQQPAMPTWGQGTPIATMQTGLALGPHVPQMHYGTQPTSLVTPPPADATPPAAPKHEEVFKRLETIIDKAHSITGGPDTTKKADVSPRASTTDQEAFDKMLGKSQLVGQLQTDVGKVQTQVCTINASMDGMKTEQKSGFGRLEALMMNFTSSASTKSGPKPVLPVEAVRSPASSRSAETPSPPSSPAPTLIDSNADENMVSSNTHDELVRLLELNSASSVVVRARPKEDTCVSLARWLNKILSSKRVCNWQDTLISMGHEESVAKSLEDIDAIFDFLLGRIQSNTRGAKMSLTGS